MTPFVGESYILMAITKINIDKGSAPVLVQGVSRGLRRNLGKLFKEVSKQNVKFGYIFCLTEPKIVFSGYHMQGKQVQSMIKARMTSNMSC